MLDIEDPRRRSYRPQEFKKLVSRSSSTTCTKRRCVTACLRRHKHICKKFVRRCIPVFCITCTTTCTRKCIRRYGKVTCERKTSCSKQCVKRRGWTARFSVCSTVFNEFWKFPHHSIAMGFLLFLVYLYFNKALRKHLSSCCLFNLYLVQTQNANKQA